MKSVFASDVNFESVQRGMGAGLPYLVSVPWFGTVDAILAGLVSGGLLLAWLRLRALKRIRPGMPVPFLFGRMDVSRRSPLGYRLDLASRLVGRLMPWWFKALYATCGAYVLLIASGHALSSVNLL